MGIIEAGGTARPVQNRPAFSFYSFRVKKLHADALIPTRSYATDAGLDLYAVEDVTIFYRSQAIINTGIAVAIPENVVGLVYVRSSLGFKHNITLSNSVGVIDSAYRGELKVALTNHHNTSSYEVRRGDRIAQLVLTPILLATPIEVDELDDTVRGEGGIGSTGT